MSTPSRSPAALSGLLPFLKPYRRMVLVAGALLLLAAATTLVFPMALRQLIDQGLAAGVDDAVLAWRFAELFAVAMALARIYPGTEAFDQPLHGLDFRPSIALKLWVLPLCLKSRKILCPEAEPFSARFKSVARLNATAQLGRLQA